MVVVLRRVEAVNGDSEVDVVLDPRAAFGKHKMSRLSREQGVWTAKCGPLHVQFSGAETASVAEGVLRLRLLLEKGRRTTWCWNYPKRHCRRPRSLSKKLGKPTATGKSG